MKPWAKKIFRILLYSLGISIFISLIVKYDFIGSLSIVARHKNNFHFLVVSVIFATFTPLLRAFRWSKVAKELGMRDMGFYKSLKLTSASFFISLITPAKVGEMGRFFFNDADKGKTFRGTFFEYYVDILVLGIFSVFSVIVFVPVPSFLLVVTLMLLLIGGVCLLFHASITERLMVFFSKNKFVALRKFDAEHCVKSEMSNMKIVFISIIASILIFFTAFMAAYFIFLFLAYPVAFPAILSALSVGRLLGVISFIPMGLGAREASSLGVLYSLGYSPAMIAPGLIIFRLLSMLPMAIGFVFYLSCVKRGKL